jgi:hypothetical protein
MLKVMALQPVERMEEITVTVFSEMGHLTMEPYLPKISSKLFGLILEKAFGKYTIATDKKGLGCTFLILSEGVEKKETFTFENKVVTVIWALDEFNPEHMKWPTYNDT